MGIIMVRREESSSAFCGHEVHHFALNFFSVRNRARKIFILLKTMSPKELDYHSEVITALHVFCFLYQHSRERLRIIRESLETGMIVKSGLTAEKIWPRSKFGFRTLVIRNEHLSPLHTTVLLI